MTTIAYTAEEVEVTIFPDDLTPEALNKLKKAGVYHGNMDVQGVMTMYINRDVVDDNLKGD